MERHKPAAWLEEIRKALASGEDLLVVCRTGATEREVYRQLERWSREGGPAGWPGLHLTTIAGLSRTATPTPLAPTAPETQIDLPPKHPWRPLLAERPGLRRLLRQHVERAQCLHAAGADLRGLRDEIRSLVTGDWTCPEHLDGCRCLLAGDEPYPRAFAVGFAPAPFTFLGQVTALERSILATLKAQFVQAGEPLPATPKPLPARRVPDVSAEARVAAKEAESGDGTLILVADGSTEDRIRAALRRNDILCAADGSSPLRDHSLVALLRRFLPLFASRGTEPLEAQDLLRLATDPVLSRIPVKTAFDAVDGVDEPRASVRQLHALIVECRRVRGSLDDWLKTVERLAALRQAELEQDDPDETEGARGRLVSARALVALLRTLAKHARAGGLLGDMAHLVNELGLASPQHDRLAHAIVRSLADDGSRPAEGDAFDEALAGGVPSGRVDAGVQVLRYEQYDGRPSRKLILTGVHDKGLAKAPPPDPFLDAESRRALELLSGEEAVAERLALARWAASRAGDVLALVAECDASGRSVKPPVLLELDLPDGKKVQRDSYGLGVALPETADRDAYGPGAGARDPLSLQIDAEWAREGSAFETESKVEPLDPDASLAEHLDRDLGRFPEDLHPWLGKCGATAKGGDGLPPDFALSATRLRSFAQCLYRAFADSVLRLKARRDVEEDVDPMEVGNAVHKALEIATPGTCFVVPAAELATAKKKLKAALRDGLKQGMKEALKTRGIPDATPAVQTARDALLARWQRHWELYVDEQVSGVEALELAELERALKPIKETEAFQVVLGILGQGFDAGPLSKLGKGLVDALVATRADEKQMATAAPTIEGRLSNARKKDIDERLLRQDVRKALERLCKEAKPLIGHIGYDPEGDLEVLRGEYSFGRGHDADAKTPKCELKLGRMKLEVHGRIDQVVLHRGHKGDAKRFRITDYKTGKSIPKAGSLAGTLTEPQLALYALALEAIGLPEAGKQPVVVEHVRIDGVRALEEAQVALTRDAIERARTVFGKLLDLSRDGFYPAIPHPEACPLLKQHGAYCDFQELCRVRPTFGPDEEEAAEPAQGDEEAAS